MGARLAWGLLWFATVVALGRSGPADLVGTWQLVSRIDRDTAGNVVPEPGLGSDPKGYLIYDATGHVAAQLMKGHRSSNPCEVTAEARGNNVAAVGGYDAYFGRYDVDWSSGTVTHILDGALAPSDVGRRLSRRFKLEGESLTIQFEPGGKDTPQVTRTLIWRRISR